MNKFLIKCWDKDIYIIESKFKTPAELEDHISQFEKVDMPNGDRIKTASIEKVTTYASYQFQVDQKQRHRKGQFLRGGKWNDHVGEVCDAGLEKITGDIKTIKKIGGGKLLTKGK